MFDRNTWGPGIDFLLWRNLMDSDMGRLRNDLWCSVIRTIAAKIVEHHPELLIDPDGEKIEIHSLLNEWKEDSMPPCSDLLMVIGESDYFRDTCEFCWDEFPFVGDACGCVSDILWDLKVRYEYQADEITEERIESFFEEWRTHFLYRVCEEAKKLAIADQGSSD